MSPTLIKAGLKIIHLYTHCYARDCPGFKELFWNIVLMGVEVYFFQWDQFRFYEFSGKVTTKAVKVEFYLFGAKTWRAPYNEPSNKDWWFCIKLGSCKSRTTMHLHSLFTFKERFSCWAQNGVWWFFVFVFSDPRTWNYWFYQVQEFKIWELKSLVMQIQF